MREAGQTRAERASPARAESRDRREPMPKPTPPAAPDRSSDPQAEPTADRPRQGPAPPARESLADEPSPPVEPVVLRGRPPRHRREPRGPLRAPAAAGVAERDTLVDAITRRVLETLAVSLRDSVHAAVLELAPRMEVALRPERAPASAEAERAEPQAAEAAGSERRARLPGR